MVVIGKPRIDSVEDFLQQNALEPNNVIDLGDTTDTASIASTLQTQSSVPGVVITIRGGQRRQERPPRYPRPSDSPSSRKSMGVRKWRRYQNNLGLLSGIEEEDSVETSFAEDIAEETSGGFSDLFEDPEKMQAWDNFTKMSEGAQRKFLMKMAEDFEHQHENSLSDELPRTAEECFRRIDRNLRRLVARRSPPVDLIEPMEEELLEFFGERPQDILDVIKPDVYHRMVFHAICQYFGLNSKSVKTRETCHTRVRNRSRNFLRPPQRLSVYLTERYCG
ncbi:R3H domain-containing protein 4-like [Paramacrobiotus metropolitanus]|uniref:R3H domain-containing protein 4-like n=1 Tax=Paramacrobiotus metropolitanus TaxID=2943436 RepID=UPI0024459868|nr:R3H domain-containing protein 4-like [Paramacrobiotus metropolitanus]XP_055351237.1 R3H domain-containing protein 4-like [Paramacrobiotus metropolitanus]